MLMDGKEYVSRCGDKAILQYFGRNCQGFALLYLPDGGEHEIEVIDIWEMTKSTIIKRAVGRVKVPLPGKEGIALLATRK